VAHLNVEVELFYDSATNSRRSTRARETIKHFTQKHRPSFSYTHDDTYIHGTRRGPIAHFR
jgi:hypothetical protein